jgi:CBS domain-containing protein
MRSRTSVSRFHAVRESQLQALRSEEEWAMRVSQLMSGDIVRLHVDARLDLAADLMRQNRIRHLPVVRDGELVGIVSQRDLFRAGLSTVLKVQPSTNEEWLQRVLVRDVMVTELITIAPGSDVEEAVVRLLDHRIGCLPVVADGKLIGLLSETDCLRYLRRILRSAEVKRRIAEEEPLTDLA